MLPALSEEARKRMTSGQNQYSESPTAELREGSVKGEAVEVAARLLGIGATNEKARPVAGAAPTFGRSPSRLSGGFSLSVRGRIGLC